MSKMHADEFEIDIALVKGLILGQFPQWARLSLKPVPSIGTDNALFRLGDDMVVRLPRIDWAAPDVEKECNWLPKIASFLPVAIPSPIAKGTPTVDYPWPWSIYHWLEGTNPIVGSIPNPDLLTRDLVGFIQAMHKINLPNGPISNRGVPLKQKQDIETQRALKQLDGMIDVQAAASIWEATLNAPQWTKPPVWVHGDLSPGNLLLKNGSLSAVIDFGNLGIGDPACDLIIAWNLLPAQMRQAFRRDLGVDDATWQRGKGWALSCALIALPYYKNTNRALASNARYTVEQIIDDDRRQTC